MKLGSIATDWKRMEGNQFQGGLVSGDTAKS